MHSLQSGKEILKDLTLNTYRSLSTPPACICPRETAGRRRRLPALPCPGWQRHLSSAAGNSPPACQIILPQMFKCNLLPNDEKKIEAVASRDLWLPGANDLNEFPHSNHQIHSYLTLQMFGLDANIHIKIRWKPQYRHSPPPTHPRTDQNNIFTYPQI